MIILVKIYPVIYFLSISLILIEAFTYPGFLLKNLRLETTNIILLFSALTLIYYLLKIKITNMLIKINSVFFSFFLASGVILTVIEKINYPNFIYSTVHIHFEIFTYLSLITFILFLFSKETEHYKKNNNISIFILGIIILFFGFLLRNWPDGTFFQLIREDKIFEQLQFIFYLIAGIFSGILMLKSFSLRKPKILILFYLLFFSLLIFIAGEEISWGQRILNITTPENLAAINTQEETTLHNINVLNPFQYLMYMALSLALSFSWIFRNHFPKNINEIFPGKNLIPFFLPIFIFYLHMNFLNGSYWEWQEFTELLLSLGLLIFFYLNFKNAYK